MLLGTWKSALGKGKVLGAAGTGIISGLVAVDLLSPGSLRNSSNALPQQLYGNTGGYFRQFAAQCAPARSFLHVGAYCKSKSENINGHKPAAALKEVASRPSFCQCDCGEDAFFFTRSASSTWFGVADGVGGWRESGIDPSLFAWGLSENCRGAAEQQPERTPKEVLNVAYEKLKRDGKVKAGSSTACVLSFDSENSVLRFANLGDSGFLVIRSEQVAYRTSEQQHFFNAPYQLSVVPKHMRGSLQDSPLDAQEGALQLEQGDIVILGTDGVFDNMYDAEILQQVQRTSGDCGSVEKDPQKFCMKLAENVVNESRRLATDDKRISPFARSATAAYRQRIYGGKWDDVTVMCACVGISDENGNARGG
eukprot:Nk52_evm98s914 gene=Nk52_evmTU98s914